MVAAFDNDFCVRLMEEEDLPQIMAIETASYEFCWNERIFRDCMRVGYCCLVLADHDVIHGYGILMVGPQEAHVLNICIENLSRGQGWARHMMLEMIDFSAGADCSELFLEVRPSNPVAFGLYESLGFNEIGRRPNYYKAHGGREDAIVMALTLKKDQGAGSDFLPQA